ncbi:MAG: repeat-containing protein [Bacteroidetes bacterium]|jgi:PKD repeat protein|nr:repeat-containing protein [Bacteroidota bacterium]
MKKILLLTGLLIAYSQLSAQCTASFTFSTSPANDGVVAFTSSTNAMQPASYYWNFSDGTVDYSENPIHTFLASGTFEVCLTISDSSAMCTTTYCDTFVVVNNSPPCEASFSYVFDSLGYSYLADNSLGYQLDYLWNFGDGTSSTTSGWQTHLFPGPGMWPVCLTVSNAATGCSNTFCDSILVTSCYAGFSYTFDAFGNGCTFTSQGTGSADTYYWNFGDGSTSTATNPYHIFTSNGSYNVQLTITSSTDSLCSDTQMQYLYAHYICDAHFSIIQDSTNVTNYLVYNSTPGSSAANYFWDFGDGTTSTLQYPTHTYAANMPYYICLTVSDASGCTDTYCDSINTGHGATPISLTVVAPAMTGISSVEETSSTLENYPNPFNESTIINYSISKDANVELYVMDLLGNVISTIDNSRKQSGNYNATWNAADVASGIYLLQMKVNDQLIIKKIVVSK